MLKSNPILPQLATATKCIIQQKRELLELFTGIETRNKYEILDERKNLLAYAAEQGRGLGASVSRYFLGHWRSFDIYLFDINKKMILKAHHPFKMFFSEINVFKINGSSIGKIVKRFALLSKKIEILDSTGRCILSVNAPFWSFWTFPIFKNYREVAKVQKKWSGLFSEAFLDRDNFLIEFTDRQLSEDEKILIIVSGIFIDLQYFEKKARK